MMISCPTCKSPNEAGATFCDQCGTALTGSGATVSPSQFVTPPAAPVPGGHGCPSCGTPVIAGEAFCDSCGAALPMGGAAAMIPAVPVVPAVRPAAVSTPPPAPSAGITAQFIATTGQTFALTGKSTYLLGREDPVSGIYPDVDTASSGGETSGVSRRHAEILQQGNQWMIRDLGSTNGTFVNNQRLGANAQQRINPGDQIRLGTWAGKFQA
ncbi:MAG: FHA domain-containing protein [Caldilineaceae bacterium]|nr:FHA domain-containing protein [Caldilineaceae bacterium]